MRFAVLLAIRNLALHWNRHLLTSLGLLTGIIGIILFGGYVLRMEGYLATHTIFLRHVGHISVLKKDSPLNYQKNPSQYSFNSDEQAAITEVIQSLQDELQLVKAIPFISTSAMLTDSCRSFPVWIQGVKSEDMKWLYTHPDVQLRIPELTVMFSGDAYWNKNQIFAANTTPVLWNFFSKAPFDTITDETRKAASEIQGCESSENKTKASLTNEMQIFSQDFYGGLGLVDTEVTGLKYSGFSLTDEIQYLAPFELVQSLVKSDNIQKWSLYFKDSSHVSKKISLIEKHLKQKGIDSVQLFPYTSAEVSELYIGNMTFIMIMFLFFIVLICGVVVLTVFNSLQIAFLERKKDISIYKSIGFRNSIVTQVFQIEYFFISIFCCVFGGILGSAIANVNNLMNIRFRPPGYSATVQFRLEPSSLFIICVFIFVIILVQLVSYLQIQRLLKRQSAELMRFDS